MTAPFISTADLGALLGQDVTASDLAIIAIDSACETIRGYLDNQINLVLGAEERLDGTGTDTLLLRQRPVRNVSTVVEDDEELAVDDDYFLGWAGILYRVGARWSRGRGNVVVTYDHGWNIVEASGSGDFVRVPSDIRRVALSLASRMFSGGGSSGAVVSRSIGPEAYSEKVDISAGAAALLPDERAILDRYVSPGVA